MPKIIISGCNGRMGQQVTAICKEKGVDIAAGFDVYAEKKNNQSTLNMIEYAVRYTGKPAMAESRIIDYDGEYVTFWYQRHEDNKLIKERVHVYDFFKRLNFHIPDENFKTVRYYGIYAKKHKFHDK